MSATGEGAKGSESHLVDPLGPCPACGIPLDGDRRCKVCGFEIPDPRLGTIVAEKYRIDSVLGEGGMGVVYRGTHLTLGEAVAIKFLRHQLSARSEFRARFRREAVILARLRHPAIVSVLDFGELDGELYMVMELIAGTPFSDVIETNGVPMPWIRVGPVFDEILGVLEAAHAAGIVHRDLKPENVMLLDATDRSDRVKVLDFGIAFLEESEAGGQRLTETGTIRGTPLYMSPEQCKGVHVTSASDIYSAGVMLFEAVTGVLPFDAVDGSGIMVQHMFVEPPLLAASGIRPAASRGLEDLVQQAMAKGPAKRPTARTFREELARVIRGTDLGSFAERGAGERSRAAALSRSDRAITGLGGPSEPAAIQTTESVVALWLPDLRRASDLRSALAVHNIVARALDPGELAGQSSVDPRRVGAIVTGDAATIVDAESMIRRLRTGPFAKLPLLYIGANGAGATTALVRAGASDVSLTDATDDEIARKAGRLLRRGR